MKKLFAIIIAISAGLSVSCSKDDVAVNQKKVAFKATAEPATKIILDGNKVVWQSGDQITIVDAASNVGVYSTTSTTSHADFTFESGTEATTPDYKAYYPVTMYNSGTPTLPATQNYVEGNISGSPMYAESSTETLAFKNICGIVRLNVSSSQIGKKVRKIILSADQGMSGAITNAATLATDGYVATVGAIIIGTGTYKVVSNERYVEHVEKSLDLPQLNGTDNVLYFTLKESDELLVIKYYVEKDSEGNDIDTWCYETWRKVNMPTAYPKDLVR